MEDANKSFLSTAKIVPLKRNNNNINNNMILETLPEYFLSNIPNSHSVQSKATWTSTILLGSCKEWDLYWPWNLLNLAYHCKKQKPRLWTCPHPSFHFLSNCNASISGRNATFVGRDHTSQISDRILRREKYTELIYCLYHQVDIIVSWTFQKLLSERKYRWKMSVNISIQI